MSWTPTDEQVEKATEALLNQTGLSMYDTTGADFLARADDESVDEYRHAVRAVLVAVGPHIAAQALRDYADTFPHPTGGRATDVREYADQIEKEAGR